MWGIDHSDSLSGGGRVAAVWVKASRCGGPRAGGREGWGAGHRALGLHMFQGDVGGQGRGLNIEKLFLFVPLPWRREDNSSPTGSGESWRAPPQHHPAQAADITGGEDASAATVWGSGCVTESPRYHHLHLGHDFLPLSLPSLHVD